MPGVLIAPAHSITSPASMRSTPPRAPRPRPRRRACSRTARGAPACRADPQVRPRAHLGRQIRLGGADPPPVDLVHRVRAVASRAGRVAVRARRQPALRASLEERGLKRHELALRWRRTGSGPSAAVVVAAEVEVALEPAERRQARVEAPLGQPERGPLVVVLGLAAQRDAGIDRRRAAHHAPARQRRQERSRARLVPVAPVVRRHRVARSVAQIGGQLAGQVVRSRLEQQHLAIAARGEPARRARNRSSQRPR